MSSGLERYRDVTGRVRAIYETGTGSRKAPRNRAPSGAARRRLAGWRFDGAPYWCPSTGWGT